MDERLVALGLGRRATTQPLIAARPTALLRQAVRLREGRHERDALCEIDGSGFRVSDTNATRAVPWPDLRAMSVENGEVRLVTPTGAFAIALTLDGVVEPALAPLFAQVLEQARGGALDPQAGASHDLANAVDAVLEGFADADDPVVPAAVGLLSAVVAIILVAALPIALELVARVTPAPGAFVLQPRIAAYDPRSLVAAIAGALALAAVVVRAVLGDAARSWARGTLRGWHRNAASLEDRARRAAARLVLRPGLVAATAAIAVLLLAPSAFGRTVVDQTGVHSASGLPLLSRDQSWATVVDVVPVAVGISERPEGFATTLVFADGSRLSTRGRDLFGGSERLLFDFARARLK